MLHAFLSGLTLSDYRRGNASRDLITICDDIARYACMIIVAVLTCPHLKRAAAADVPLPAATPVEDEATVEELLARAESLANWAIARDVMYSPAYSVDSDDVQDWLLNNPLYLGVEQVREIARRCSLKGWQFMKKPETLRAKLGY